MSSTPQLSVAAPAPSINLDDPSLYINRELSWLEFNRRVLEEAQDKRVPFMERLKFLAIVSSNLDEFFMVRVGGLMQKVHAGITRSSGADRTTPKVQLEKISQHISKMVQDQYHVLTEEVLPALEKEGIVIKSTVKQLTEADKKHLRENFRREVFPVLTPLAIDPGHPFPHLANKTLNLAVVLERPSHPDKLYAVVQVPAVLRRFMPIPVEGGYCFASLEAVTRLHLAELFPGMKIDHATVFRVTRDSEYEIEDEEVEDLLKAIEESVRKRRRGTAVRLEIEADAPEEVVNFLTSALDLDTSADVFRVPGLIDLTGLFQVYGLPGFPHLRDPHFVPHPVPDIANAANIWAAIRTRDILMHHPYESFNPVVDFIETAAADERVLAIKQTLYRTSSDSPVVRALQRAADAGKQVTAVIELKARLDEERNIAWARELEKSGVHVVFGFVGLKTHCKVALVVRREEDGIRRYVHLGTGNYNPQTARLYTDLGMFTCNPDFADDVSALFNYLTGYSELPEWKKLIVAPSRMQNFMVEMIDREAEFEKAGKGGRFIAKVNGILEPVIVQALYRASRAGMKSDIVCRGICALRPGIPGVSENIRVVSIVDRYLEHSRIYYFGNGGDPVVYVGSADLMDRNLSRRVEVIFPIEQPDLKQRVIKEILEVTLSDTAKSRELQSDGSYKRVEPSAGAKPVSSQSIFQANAADAKRDCPPMPPPGDVEEKPIRRNRKRNP
ncbi:polyphosphate kinase 1 [Zavarzinella formosa]|uniref:polyphosphate kinase 1 n=1 Tax=Zavarzinella formosa TaxID=360055 RepID=UPI0002E48299|nr:polyphosphate kinase 1 [Zavarzinella formosa]